MSDLRTIARKLDALSDQVRSTDRKVETIKQHLVGTLDERGLTRRVEDLETNEQKRARYVTAALLAAVTALVTWPFRLLWNAIAGGGD